MKCNFCSAANPTWLHPAESFDVGIGTRSIEDLAACEECHRLIDAGDRGALIRHAVEHNTNPAIRVLKDEQWALDLVCEMYEEFFAARRGPARRIGAAI